MKQFLDALIKEQENAKVRAVAKRPDPGISCDYHLGYSQGYFAGLVEAQKIMNKYINDENARDFDL